MDNKEKSIRAARRFFVTMMAMIGVIVLLTGRRVYAGSTLSTAEPATLGTTIAGTLYEDDLNKGDVYKFTLSRSSCIHIYAKTEGHICVLLRDSTGAPVIGHSTYDIVTSDKYNWGYQSGSKDFSLNAGTYYMVVYKNYGKATDYKITTSVTASAGNNLAIAGSKNCSLSTAARFTIGNTLKGAANCCNVNDSGHYFRFSLSKKSKVRFICKGSFTDNSGSSVSFDILNSAGKKAGLSAICKRSAAESKVLQGTLNKGTYYIRVISWTENDLPYTITTADLSTSKIAVPTVSNVKVSSPASGKLNVRWKKQNCTGYQLQYSANKNLSSGVYTRNIGSTYNSYTRKGLTRGKYYYVRMRAYKFYNGKCYVGKWSTIKAVKIR